MSTLREALTDAGFEPPKKPYVTPPQRPGAAAGQVRRQMLNAGVIVESSRLSIYTPRTTALWLDDRARLSIAHDLFALGRKFVERAIQNTDVDYETRVALHRLLCDDLAREAAQQATVAA